MVVFAFIFMVGSFIMMLRRLSQVIGSSDEIKLKKEMLRLVLLDFSNSWKKALYNWIPIGNTLLSFEKVL